MSFLRSPVAVANNHLTLETDVIVPYPNPKSKVESLKVPNGVSNALDPDNMMGYNFIRFCYNDDNADCAGD